RDLRRRLRRIDVDGDAMRSATISPKQDLIVRLAIALREHHVGAIAAVHRHSQRRGLAAGRAPVAPLARRADGCDGFRRSLDDESGLWRGALSPARAALRVTRH